MQGSSKAAEGERTTSWTYTDTVITWTDVNYRPVVRPVGVVDMDVQSVAIERLPPEDSCIGYHFSKRAQHMRPSFEAFLDSVGRRRLVYAGDLAEFKKSDTRCGLVYIKLRGNPVYPHPSRLNQAFGDVCYITLQPAKNEPKISEPARDYYMCLDSVFLFTGTPAADDLEIPSWECNQESLHQVFRQFV